MTRKKRFRFSFQRLFSNRFMRQNVATFSDRSGCIRVSAYLNTVLILGLVLQSKERGNLGFQAAQGGHGAAIMNVHNDASECVRRNVFLYRSARSEARQHDDPSRPSLVFCGNVCDCCPRHALRESVGLT